VRVFAVPLATVAATAAITWATIAVVGRPVAVPPKPEALSWAGRVFVSQRQFAAWLERRDASYDVWRRRHPGAAPWERATSRAPASPARPAAGPPRAAVGAAAVVLAALLAAIALSRSWQRARRLRAERGLGFARLAAGRAVGGAAALRARSIRAADAAADAARGASASAPTLRIRGPDGDTEVDVLYLAALLASVAVGVVVGVIL
jgi:hypothetical protein